VLMDSLLQSGMRGSAWEENEELQCHHDAWGRFLHRDHVIV